MARLTSVGAGRFKSIKDLQLLHLRPANILIGANGAGKSNLISFFKLLNAIAAGNLQKFVAKTGGADTILYYGAKESPVLWGAVELGGKTGDGSYLFQLSASATDSLFFLQEQVVYTRTSNSAGVPEQLGSGHKESLLTTHGNDYMEVRNILSGIRTFHFHDTSETAAIRRRGYIEDNQGLHSDAGNLAAFLYGMKQRSPLYYKRVREVIRQVAPFFDDFVLEPTKTDPQSILLNWKDCGSEHLFGPHQLSDGTLRAAALTALLLQPEADLHPVIVLDEPEIGLHPFAIEVIASLIKAAAVHSTIMVATQSIALVNHFEVEDVVVANRVRGESKFERLQRAALSEWLEDYSVGELWEKNLIQGTPSG